MNAKRALLSVVPNGMKRLSARERLIAEGKKLFPDNESMVAKWVDAKLHVAGRPLKVRVGTDEHAVFARKLPGARF
jgi:hypothetical protein